MRIIKILFVLIFIGVLGYIALLNKSYLFDSYFKADVLVTGDSTLDDLIDDGLPSRRLNVSYNFLPENTVYYDSYNRDSKELFYYVLDTPDDIIQIGIDNITSKPTCEYGWRYKFQGYSKYFRIGEGISDVDINVNDNYPVLQIQDGTNRNYSTSGNIITVYFDKNINNAQYYDFVLKNNVTVYTSYKLGTESQVDSVTINGSKLNIIMPSPYIVDDGRIIIKGNVISDMDGRVAPNSIIVGNKITGNSGVQEYVIDNSNPTCIGLSGTGSNTRMVTVFFNENIYNNPGVDILQKITNIGYSLFSDVNIDGNQLKLFFGSGANVSNVSILNGAVRDKVGNLNTSINCE